ncbi:MAG: V-type ATP synthase subunit A [Candidatus Izemoplasmatales bacterium]|nr:V-type ATP synthase subunit A [Candidatus Izemoplasmatales bacterium]MDD3865920.1 V-type ATP synthase subunit A [Candidatus Izemoplasmatales bacterium]
MNNNLIYSINGPVVTVKNANDFHMLEMVYVGNARLMGEVIGISEKETIIQVYESTTGLYPAEPVIPTGEPVSLLLGPGMMSNIFDGIERPLQTIANKNGIFVPIGGNVPILDADKIWDIQVKVKVGDQVKFGDIFALTQETSLIQHRMMIPKDKEGTIVFVVNNGKYRINDIIVSVKDINGVVHDLSMVQKWPIKTPRPSKKRLPLFEPLISGQRIIDTMFPIAKGGTAAVPGGFGTGKTMMQHQFAKWCDADIIVYVGCGERGNEMTQVLEEFTSLVDPKSHRPLTDRTILIANTSNMPVAAREASIYTGITMAEYYRDMGYHVAIMADSTSRWAEALREISGRLEEMPAEEGFPAYLPSRISQFYERAGYVENINGTKGSISIIGAVSPQGADFSEPVTQNTKRFVRCFWALDKQLAYVRHYAAINWNISYSEYVPELTNWFNKKIDVRFLQFRQKIMTLLAEENKLLEIVKLIGSDVLPDDQKLIIEIGKVIRVGFLQQSVFEKNDTYVPLMKQFRMMEVIVYLHREAKDYIQTGKALSLLINTGLFDKVSRMKYDVNNVELNKFDDYFSIIDKTISSIL